MRILMITNLIPYPPTSGGQLRAYHLLRRIAEQHEVWLAAHLFSPDDAKGIPHLETFCHRVITGRMQRRHPVAHLPGLLRFALAGWPLELKFPRSTELIDKLRHLLADTSFDIVQIEESRLALYRELLPKNTQSRCVLAFYDIGFHQMDRIARVTPMGIMKARMWLQSRQMRRWEPRYAARFDYCITVSEGDRNLLIGANPRLQVEVIPNGVDTKALQPLPDADGPPALLFVGAMHYTPSRDAALYLCDEVLPRVWQRVPAAEAWIVGADPPERLKHVDANRVHVAGWVDDVQPYYRRCRVCVTPLRAGGGTRLKILEAMALGRPVVSTALGREGLDVIDGEHLLVADDPDQIAEQIARLLNDPALVERITTKGRRLVEDHYDWDAIAAQQMELYERVSRTG
ncbi:MAG: glycosyltransferase [Anaerolineae bacterium]|nr:glycosyltransferase [Anaerolineae bacterium]